MKKNSISCIWLCVDKGEDRNLEKWTFRKLSSELFFLSPQKLDWLFVKTTSIILLHFNSCEQHFLFQNFNKTFDFSNNDATHFIIPIVYHRKQKWKFSANSHRKFSLSHEVLQQINYSHCYFNSKLANLLQSSMQIPCSFREKEGGNSLELLLLIHVCCAIPKGFRLTPERQAFNWLLQLYTDWKVIKTMAKYRN